MILILGGYTDKDQKKTYSEEKEVKLMCSYKNPCDDLATQYYCYERGPIGPTGSIGMIGPTGATGISETIQVNETFTVDAGYPAEVRDIGIAPNHVLDFVIPRGMTGATGNTGPTGAQGLMGPIG